MSKNILNIRDLSRKYVSFSEPTIRGFIKNADKNKLGHAIKRIGRRIFIDEELFLAWIESKQFKA